MITDLLDFVQPFFVGLQFGHEGLMFEPFAVQVSSFIVGHVLCCQHLLIDPQGQLYRGCKKVKLRCFSVIIYLYKGHIGCS